MSSPHKDGTFLFEGLENNLASIICGDYNSYKWNKNVTRHISELDFFFPEAQSWSTLSCNIGRPDSEPHQRRRDSIL